MAHGLSGTRRDRLGPFAERFAAAGFAALVFDHRGFGDSGGEPDLFEPRRQLEDWRAAIAFARSLPGSTPTGSRRSARRWAAATRWPPRPTTARRRRDQPGPVPRHRAPGPPLLAARSPRACCSPRRPRPSTCPRSARPDEAAFINAPGARGRLAARRRDRRGLALAQPRLLALAARPPFRPVRHARAACTARGSSASARPIASRGPGPAIAAARARAARRAAHLPGRRPLRHLRRPGPRGGRRRPDRVPAAATCRLSPRTSRAVTPGPARVYGLCATVYAPPMRRIALPALVLAMPARWPRPARTPPSSRRRRSSWSPARPDRARGRTQAVGGARRHRAHEVRAAQLPGMQDLPNDGFEQIKSFLYVLLDLIQESLALQGRHRAGPQTSTRTRATATPFSIAPRAPATGTSRSMKRARRRSTAARSSATGPRRAGRPTGSRRATPSPRRAVLYNAGLPDPRRGRAASPADQARRQPQDRRADARGSRSRATRLLDAWDKVCRGLFPLATKEWLQWH